MRTIILIAVICWCIYVAFGCQLLGPADRAELTDTAAALEKCQELGRACKDDGGANCFAVYDSCVTDAGLRN